MTSSCEAQLAVSFGVFFHEAFEVTQPRPDGAALIVSSGQDIGGLETVARDARNGEFVGLDAAVCVETSRDRCRDAASRRARGFATSGGGSSAAAGRAGRYGWRASAT